MRYVLCLCLLLVGCAETQLVPVSVPRAPLDLPLPPPLVIDPLEWHVVHDNDQAIIGLSPEGYETLARNTERMQGRIELLTDYVKQYKQYEQLTGNQNKTH